MVEIRIAVDRLELAGRPLDRGERIAGLVVGDRLVGVEAGLEERGNRRAGNFVVFGFLPGDRQGVQRLLGVPIGVGNDRDAAVADLHDLLHAWHVLYAGRVEALDLVAADGSVLDGRDQHVGELDIDAVNLLAGQLVIGVEPLEALAGDLPVLDVFELDLLRRLELGGRLRDFAEGGRAAGRPVREHAVGDGVLVVGLGRRDRGAHVRLRGRDLRLAGEAQVRRHGDRDQDAEDDHDDQELDEREALLAGQTGLDLVDHAMNLLQGEDDGALPIGDG